MTTTMPGQSRGACSHCGKQMYMSRKDAKKAAKRMYPGHHMQSYRCRQGGKLFHIGHAAAVVVAGRASRHSLYAGRIEEAKNRSVAA